MNKCTGFLKYSPCDIYIKSRPGMLNEDAWVAANDQDILAVLGDNCSLHAQRIADINASEALVRAYLSNPNVGVSFGVLANIEPVTQQVVMSVHSSTPPINPVTYEGELEIGIGVGLLAFRDKDDIMTAQNLGSAYNFYKTVDSGPAIFDRFESSFEPFNPADFELIAMVIVAPYEATFTFKTNLSLLEACTPEFANCVMPKCQLLASANRPPFTFIEPDDEMPESVPVYQEIALESATVLANHTKPLNEFVYKGNPKWPQ